MTKTKQERAEQRAQKRRLEREVHRELDQLCDLARKLAAAEALCRTDLDRSATDLIRQVLQHRAQQIGKALNNAGIAEPARDQLRN
jgi:hypothetical protein